MPARFVINFTKCTNGMAAIAPWVAVSDSLARKHWQQADQWHPANGVGLGTWQWLSSLVCARSLVATLTPARSGSRLGRLHSAREREEDALADEVGHWQRADQWHSAVKHWLQADQWHPKNGNTDGKLASGT